MSTWPTKVGLFAVISALGGYFFFPSGLKYMLKSQMNLSKGGPIYPKWCNPPFMTSTTMYLFEIENPREALYGQKMRVKRKGPYTFDVANVKEDIEFSDDEQQISYTASRKLYYKPDRSSDIDEQYYMLNPLVPTTQQLVQTMIIDRLPLKSISAPLVYNAVEAALNNYKQRLFYKQTPRKILFGYKLEILDRLEEVARRFGVSAILSRATKPSQNNFGLAYSQNVTKSEYTVYTGIGNPDRFGDIVKYNGQDTVSFWKAPCNKIQGSTGELFRPYPQTDKPMRLFMGPVCRTIYLDPVGKSKLLADYGLEAVEYEISKRVFQGTKSNPSNACFCKDKTAIECKYDGLINLGPCLYNIPAYASKVNFENVDPIMKETVTGVQDGEYPQNDTFLMDPITGAIFYANVAIMASLKVQRQPAMRDLGRVQNMSLVPYFVTHQEVDIPKNMLSLLVMLQNVANNYKLIFYGLGAGGAVAAAYGLRMGSHRKVEPIKQVDIDIDDDSKNNGDVASKTTGDRLKPIDAESNNSSFTKSLSASSQTASSQTASSQTALFADKM